MGLGATGCPRDAAVASCAAGHPRPVPRTARPRVGPVGRAPGHRHPARARRESACSHPALAASLWGGPPISSRRISCSETVGHARRSCRPVGPRHDRGAGRPCGRCRSDGSCRLAGPCCRCGRRCSCGLGSACGPYCRCGAGCSFPHPWGGCGTCCSCCACGPHGRSCPFRSLGPSQPSPQPPPRQPPPPWSIHHSKARPAPPLATTLLA